MVNRLTADSFEVKIIDFELADILPKGEEQILSDNAFSLDMPEEQMLAALPSESIYTEEFPNKIISSRISNIWYAGDLIKRLGFSEISELMKHNDPAKRPTICEVKQKLIDLKNQEDQQPVPKLSI